MIERGLSVNFRDLTYDVMCTRPPWRTWCVTKNFVRLPEIVLGQFPTIIVNSIYIT